MNATDVETEPVTRLSDFPEGSMKMVKVDGQRVCLARTASGVHALDHACPHEGYGLTQGVLDGETLTCAWHNWKFRVSDGACVLGEENVQTHDVTVDDDGGVRVSLSRPDPADVRVRVTESLRRGIERDYIGQVSRDVVRLLQADAHPGELIWQAIAHGAPRGEFGWGHSIASATDCLSMIDLYAGDQRALPIVQGIAGIAESERDRPAQSLPDPTSRSGTITSSAFRKAVETEQLADAQSIVRAAIHRGDSADELRPWFTQIVSDHHLSYGHAAIYSQKAFELLDMIGWERADTVLPHLVPTIVYGTREDGLPYMRPFMKAMADVDLATLARVDVDPRWSDDGRLADAILGRDRIAPVDAVTDIPATLRRTFLCRQNWHRNRAGTQKARCVATTRRDASRSLSMTVGRVARVGWVADYERSLHAAAAAIGMTEVGSSAMNGTIGSQISRLRATRLAIPGMSCCPGRRRKRGPGYPDHEPLDSRSIAGYSQQAPSPEAQHPAGVQSCPSGQQVPETPQ